MKSVFFTLIPVLLFAVEIITPQFRLHSKGSVTDFVIDGNYLYASNDVGSIDIFDLYSQKIVDQIVLEPIKDFMGDDVMPKIYSVDRMHGKTVFTSTGKHGFRNVFLHDGKHLTKIISTQDKLFIKEVRFIEDEKLLFALLSDELILYDSAEKYKVYRKQIDAGALSDIALNEDRSVVASTDESGEVKLIDVKSSNIIKVLGRENVDNVYRLTYNAETVITAGQDRRVGIYKKDGSSYHLKSDFLVYCASLSPSAKYGVYAAGEDNELQVFEVESKRKLARLKGHSATLTTIKFVSENELFSAAEESDILFWRF